ncbi:MAG TPA: alcohol dehydrogenase catalytic domain-containing protein [Caulobacteraceae bacterium]|nr:alcohol dehydrogenase catalytic domain-containing protein [Caulobacteraceae bacterium]
MQISAALANVPGGAFSIEAVELDEPRADETRVRIAAVGVCHTDLVARDGAMPFTLPAVLGHEGAGVVDAVGASVGGRRSRAVGRLSSSSRTRRGAPWRCSWARPM